MPHHLDADDLAAFALGPAETALLTPAQRAHLRSCAPCRKEIDQLREAIRTARDITSDDLLVEPPASLWESISAGLAEQDPPDTTVPEAPRGPGAPAGRRRPAVLLAAAALGVGMVLGGAVTHVVLDGRPTSAPAPAVSGTRRSMVGLGPARAAGGTVETREEAGDGRHIVLAVTGLPAIDGFYEVWLMDRTHRKLVALGVLHLDGTATLPAPEGIDLAAYPLVDISAQDDNGDPAHSGRSVLRGDLWR
ncbi:hypothetical protein GCM10010329_79350 [Streptomyces spiroverticillatus]|uniref:Anti-sigma K factor RskA C-terminal domain-containing protein n=1 Tax=Streptomyces finlayi TaxID=67296 RepID=A0A918X8L5_9ACTN|nr:anti-sigma factor [Streptomyces finlayi]GHA44785.1 hypothetical protein GCM10010329_79350 [Streptomyces spiroverticillatus]GHD17993.1 hypothetical protein GCM10010334_80330 [Streptomyces finlayi]